jgi:hypothetical protein
MPDLLEKKKPSSLDDVIRSAWKDLESRNPEVIADHSGGELKGGVLDLSFLGQHYSIDLQREEVRNKDGSITNRFFATLILHYLVGVDESGLTGELVSFRDFWGGEAYYGAFMSRAIQPIKEAFADSPQELETIARRIGGRKADHGDVSVEIPIFPKISLIVIIWEGDEEIPGTANILFDRLAGRILHTEDLAAIGELTAKMLVS